jgi:serine/threonine protein kinase
MGICESDNINNNFYNKVRIDGEVKDLSKDYLLEESIKIPIKTKYKLEEIKIGRGSSGQVLLGSDKEGRAYAIKVIRKKLILNGQLLANEVRIGTKLNHPNILGIKEVYEDMKTISIVMEYCESGDLFDFIMNSPQKRLDDFNTIDLLIQILSSLDYLHNVLKICHRDLKPENFLISINQQNRPILKLIDFGLATYIYRGEKMKGKIGTTMYMAPEILKNEPFNEKIDVWSAGIILFNMMTGCEPFASGNEKFKQYQIINKPINFDVIKNDYLRELCQEMLEKDPEKRLDAATSLEKAIIIKRKIFNEF